MYYNYGPECARKSKETVKKHYQNINFLVLLALVFLVNAKRIRKFSVT